MKCDKAQNLILLDAAGGIGDAARDEMTRHLSACAACREFEASNAAITAMVGRALPDGEPSARVMSVIASAAKDAGGSRGVFVFTAWNKVLALAATLMAVVGAAVYMSGSDPAHPAIADVSAMAAAMNAEEPQSVPEHPSGDRDEAIRELGKQLLSAEGLADEEDDLVSEALLFEPDSTDPRSSNTGASPREGRA